mmetsp:Transcript_51423/g.146836  ORF Transcript_51423/g.146836 Transcript_51423/m.146836 type:complete len:201 (+) Transcript_51423:432-1034(+)
MQVKKALVGVPSTSVTLHADDVETMRTPKSVVEVVLRVSSDAPVRIWRNLASIGRMCLSLSKTLGKRWTKAMRLDRATVFRPGWSLSPMNQPTKLEMFWMSKCELDSSESTGMKYLTLFWSYCEKLPPKLSRKKYGVSPAESSRTSAAASTRMRGGAKPSPPTSSAKSSWSTRCVTSESFRPCALLRCDVLSGLWSVAVT